MDYKKIYKNIIIKAKNMNRSKTNEVYYEKHHVIPDFMFINRQRSGPRGHLEGNPDDVNNLVLLTPREHFICHVLLYKISKGTRYEYAAGSALQFFFSKVMNEHPRSKTFIGSKKYEKYRLIGLASISAARKGKFPAKDAISGISVGSVSVDHPKVLSGEWVHRTKGKKYNDPEHSKKISLLTSGDKNPNYKNINPSVLLEILKSCITEDRYCSKKLFFSKFNQNKSRKEKISNVYITNHYGGWEKFLEFAKTQGIDVEYKGQYYRSTEQKKLLSEIGKNKRWVNNQVVQTQIDAAEIADFISQNPEYKLGKLR